MTDGDSLWRQAREMAHTFVPTEDTDRAYLDLVHQAAEAGHAEATAKLGEYAIRKGTLVEAYFWMLMAEKRGWKRAGVALRNLRDSWKMAGYRSESTNVTTHFTAERGSLARAFLRRDCRVDTPYARKRLAEFVAKGDKDALFLLG